MPAGVLIGAIVAQAVTQASPDRPDLNRVRQALAAPPAITTRTHADDEGKPVFRMNVRGWRFDHAVWHDDTTVPLYVRPSMPPVHFEFLQQVTPEFFRSSVLFPGYPTTPYGALSISVPVIPVVETLTRAVRKHKRRVAEEAGREEVRQDLARLLACRADQTRAGC